MTIKENNEQINKRLDNVVNFFEIFRDEYRMDKKYQNDINIKILTEATINKTNIKNMQKLPVFISAIASALGVVSVLIVIINGG